ncbi:MAG: ABC transporter permease [Planctomycetota bacterium]|nr:ABC transporter permease [Planctomycetota bacterium]
MAEDTTAASSPSAARNFLRRVVSAQESGLLLVIALMMTGLTIFGGTTQQTVIDQDTGQALRDDDGRPVRRDVNTFLNSRNLILLANNASFIAVMAVAMTAVIVTAGIDLSVGSIYALAGIVAAEIINGMPPDSGGIVAAIGLIGVACAAGGVLGLANGAMIVGFRLHPFIITLGTMSVYRGITLLLTKGQTVSGLPEAIQPGFFKADLGIGAAHPTNTIIMLLVALLGWFVLRYTVFGRRVFAVGGNETAARYAGIPVGRVTVLVYTLMGVAAGLAGAMAVGYLGAATSGAGQAYELRVIAGAVIGGASLTGGRGTAIGAVLGTIVIELINNAMTILQIDSDYLYVVTGAVIILAAVIDRAKQGLQTR